MMRRLVGILSGGFIASLTGIALVKLLLGRVEFDVMGEGWMGFVFWGCLLSLFFISSAVFIAELRDRY
jgi:hypothetical protein